jgi:hypothetical protein
MGVPFDQNTTKRGRQRVKWQLYWAQLAVLHMTYFTNDLISLIDVMPVHLQVKLVNRL